MIQLTQQEYDELVVASAERDRLKELLVDVRDQLSGALITTGPVVSCMIAVAIESIDKGTS